MFESSTSSNDFVAKDNPSASNIAKLFSSMPYDTQTQEFDVMKLHIVRIL